MYTCDLCKKEYSSKKKYISHVDSCGSLSPRSNSTMSSQFTSETAVSLLNKVKKNKDKYKEELKNLSKQREIESGRYQTTILNLNKKCESLEEEIEEYNTQLESEKKRIKTQLAAKIQKIDKKYKDDLNEYTEKMSVLERENKDLHNKIQNTDDSVYIDRIKLLENSNRELQSHMKNVVNNRQELLNQIETLKSKYENELVKNIEGKNKEVRNTIQQLIKEKDKKIFNIHNSYTKQLEDMKSKRSKVEDIVKKLEIECQNKDNLINTQRHNNENRIKDLELKHRKELISINDRHEKIIKNTKDGYDKN